MSPKFSPEDLQRKILHVCIYYFLRIYYVTHHCHLWFSDASNKLCLLRKRNGYWNTHTVYTQVLYRMKICDFENSEASWPCPEIRTIQLSSIVSNTSAMFVSLSYSRAAVWTGYSWTEVKFRHWNNYHFIIKNSANKTNFSWLLRLWCFITLYQTLISFIEWILLRFTWSLLRYVFTKCRTERIQGRSSACVCPSACFISDTNQWILVNCFILRSKLKAVE
jgi:hypothetical protein